MSKYRCRGNNANKPKKSKNLNGSILSTAELVALSTMPIINEPAKILPHNRKEIEIRGATWPAILIGLIITGILLPFLVVILNVYFLRNDRRWYLNPTTKIPINVTKPNEIATDSEEVGLVSPKTLMVLEIRM
jgi:hypothetical protein